jgi:hypothetical protein
MEWKQATMRAGFSAPRPLQVAPRQAGIYEPNFGLLTTWWTIIAGKLHVLSLQRPAFCRKADPVLLSFTEIATIISPEL